MARPTRNEQEIEAVRHAILDAATRVFARVGIEAATMAEIAADADYTAPSLYNYFAGKEQLVEAILERLNREFMATFDEPLPDDADFERRIELLMLRQGELASLRRDAFRVFMGLGAHALAGSRRHVKPFEHYIERLAAWMGDALAHGGPKGRDPLDLAWCFWGIGHAFHLRWMLAGARRPLTESARVALDVFLDGVRKDAT